MSRKEFKGKTKIYNWDNVTVTTSRLNNRMLAAHKKPHSLYNPQSYNFYGKNSFDNLDSRDRKELLIILGEKGLFNVNHSQEYKKSVSFKIAKIMDEKNCNIDNAIKIYRERKIQARNGYLKFLQEN